MKNKRILIPTLFLLCFFSQPSLWSQFSRFHNKYDDNGIYYVARSIVNYRDQFTLTTGSYYDPNNWMIGIPFVTKTDINGNVIQTVLYFPSTDQSLDPQKIIRTSDNNFVILSRLASNWDAPGEIQLTKIDQNLDVIWSNKYESSHDVWANDLIEDSKGNLVSVGVMEVSLFFRTYLLVTKSNGTLLHHSVFGKDWINYDWANVYGTSVTESPDGEGYYITGGCSGQDDDILQPMKAMLLKADNAANLVFLNCYLETRPMNAICNANGKLYALGNSYSPYPQLMEFDLSGSINDAWEIKYESLDYQGEEIKVTPKGKLMCGGYGRRNGSIPGGFLYEFDPLAGSVDGIYFYDDLPPVRSNTFNPYGYMNGFFDLTGTTKPGVIYTGMYQDDLAASDMIIVSTNLNQDNCNERLPFEITNLEPEVKRLDVLTLSPDRSSPFTLQKSPVSIIPALLCRENQRVPAPGDPLTDSDDIAFYPNPFAFTTNIHLEIQSGSTVAIHIRDMQGKMIKEIINTVLNEGSYEFSWSPESFIVPGIYVAEVTINDKKEYHTIMYTK